MVFAVCLMLSIPATALSQGNADPQQQKENKPVCLDNFGSNCSSSQKVYLDSFIKALNDHGVSYNVPPPEGTPEALKGLPRDKTGQVNWTKAVMNRQIAPKDSLIPGEGTQDKPFNLIVFFQAKVNLMADVIFPHSVHTYWLSCNNCHPKIFKQEVGANPITMSALWNGKFCGKCHGTVAFSMRSEENCRRCHSMKKRHEG